MAAKKKKKQAVPAAAPVVKGKAPKAKAKAAPEKAAKPVRTGMSTTDAAAYISKKLKIEVSPVRLRRILRTDDFSNDGGYTRYDLDKDTVEALLLAVKAGGGQTSGKKGRKAKAKAAEVEAPEELDDEMEEDDESEEDESDEDEEEEEDEVEDLDEDEDEDE